MSKADPQSIQIAINACSQSHTDIHQALEQLKRGSPLAAKQKMSAAIAKISNALAIL